MTVFFFQGPPELPQYASTNHLGRQRPPPQTTKGSPDRRASVSPERARRGQFSADRSVLGSSTPAGGSVYGDLDGGTSIATMPTFMQRAFEQQRDERTFAEFHEWLAANREWLRRREFKVPLPS
jgi:hypothetical protein